ncbi:MAG: hypothetical protein IAE87_05750 [Rhodobacteraceae bacterium]|jgi:hypothetical protein|nr:hypothetical protein [Paracoccaceae bacterium]
MLGKPLEYWLALAGATIWIAARDAESEALGRRVAKIVASAALTVGLSPSVADYFNVSEIWVVVAIMAFGLVILDMLTALIHDQPLIRDLMRAWLGRERE